MNVWDAIWEACAEARPGDCISLAHLADEVAALTGRIVLEATVERYLRWWAQRPDARGRVLMTESLRPGVRRIVERVYPYRHGNRGKSISKEAGQRTRGGMICQDDCHS